MVVWAGESNAADVRRSLPGLGECAGFASKCRFKYSSEAPLRRVRAHEGADVPKAVDAPPLVEELRRIEVLAPGQFRRSEPEEHDHWPTATGTLPVAGNFA